MTETKNVASQESKPANAMRRAPTGFQAFRDEFDRMFNALSRPEMNWRSGLPGQGDAIGLRVDVSETEGEIQVTSELPGVDEKDVDVSLADDVLRIRAEKRSDSESGDKTWHVVERSYGTFERAIRVPAGIDPDSVNARFEKGILTVTMPKPPEAGQSAKKIAITSG
ncbi:MAG: Hsp20/alpha crystallin family protein [Rhodobacteraceae bacterium]|nr:MAG: Hsp20/alpha crystallin family protein [Paracoccaceae bacterium]